MEKEKNTDESDFSENEMPDLNSLKPVKFEPTTKIRDINSSQKQPSEVFCNKRCSKGFPATLLKKRLWHRCFPMNFAKFLRTPFFTEHLWSLRLNSYSHDEEKCTEYKAKRISNSEWSVCSAKTVFDRCSSK